MSLRRHNPQCQLACLFPNPPFLPFARLSASHVLIDCLLVSCVWSSPPPTPPSSPPNCFTQPHCCTAGNTFHPKPCMSHSKLAPPVITPTLHDYPRTNLVPWKVAINLAARGVFAEWDAFGFLFDVCDDAVWVVLNTSSGGRCGTDQIFRFQLILPPVLALLPATLSSAPRNPGQLGWTVAGCVTILESIGESNRLAIYRIPTQTSYICPRETSSMQ
jgi:hypothetical protein